jgi:hypothetical protein
MHEAHLPWKNLPEHIGGQQHRKRYQLTDDTRNKHAYLPFFLEELCLGCGVSGFI